MRLAMCCSSRFSLRNDFSNKLLEKSAERGFRVGLKGRHTWNRRRSGGHDLLQD